MSVNAPVIKPQTLTGPITKRSNLTRLQFLYWVSQVMRPEAPFLNTVVTLTIHGKVNAACFERAFGVLTQQSDVLRTVIVEERATPQRMVLDDMPRPLQIVDFSAEENPTAVYQTWLQARVTAPLDISKALYDAALVKLADDRYVWYFNQHHLIADASAFFIAFRTLAEAYSHFASGEPATLTQRPSYQAYVEYEHRFRESARYGKAAEYWQRKLASPREPLRLLGQAPAKKNTRVRRLTVNLGAARSEAIRTAARREGIFTINLELSLYNLFAAIFFIQLQQLSQNRRLAVVTPVHNRSSDAFRETMGLFMELCPLQIEICETDTFASVLQKVRRETRETMPYAQYGSAITESFDVMFNMHPVPSFQLHGMPVDFSKVSTGHGSESLACHVYDFVENNAYEVHFDLHEDIFTQEQSQQIVDDFVKLIDAFLDNSDRPVDPIYAPPLAHMDNSPAAVSLNNNGASRDSGARPGFVAPRDAMENQMARIWEEVMDVSQVGIHDNFFDLGGSSWLATRLFLRIQEVTGHNLPLSTLLEAATVAGMVTIIREQSEGRLWSPIITLKRGDRSRRPFFLVPGAGGNLLRLDKLVGYMDAEQTIMAFQVPGLEGKQEPFQHIEEMAGYMIGVMRDVQAHGPYLLGGYSWGGMVAFEMARQLQQQGETVDFLGIIDTPAQNPAYRKIWRAVQKLGDLFGWNRRRREKNFLVVRDFVFRGEYFLHALYQELREASLAGKVILLARKTKTAVRKVVKKAKRRRPPADREHRQSGEENDFWSRFNLDPLRLQVVRINDRSIRIYVPRPYSGSAVLFQSSEGYRNPLNRSASPNLGWGKVIQGDLQGYEIPGDHLGILEEPNVQILADKLRTALRKAVGDRLQ